MDVELILHKLEEFGYVSLNRITGDWYSLRCPFHKDGKENRPSCGVLLVDQYKNGQLYPAGLWHCFTCGFSGTMQEAVSKILKLHNVGKDAVDWLTENIPGFVAESEEVDDLIPSQMVNAIISKYAIEYVKSISSEHEQNFVSEEELASYRYTVPYMYQRKLTDEIISKYDIGYDAHWIPSGRKKEVPCITIPVRDKFGRTLFFCRRSIEGKLYNYPQGVTKPVFGVDMLPNGCKSVIICESAINALTAEVYGYDAVALLGTGNGYQIQQLKELGVNEFVICMDGDDAGRNATEKLKRNLSKVALVWTIHMPDGKDLNDCSKEEFNHLYEERD